MRADEVIARLRKMGDPAAVAGRARFGIPEDGALGVPVPALRKLAREIGRDADLARGLWQSGIPEARLLATLTMPPEAFTRPAAERWLKDVTSWDVCDGLCLNLVDKAEWAYEAARAWCSSSDEWTKRAGFATIAGLAWHDRDAPDAKLKRFFPIIEKHGADDRNYVKKAVSWALRQLGKRSEALRPLAIGSAEKLRASESKGARWAGADALRELTRPARRARSPTRGSATRPRRGSRG